MSPRPDVRGGLRLVCALLVRGDSRAALAHARGLQEALGRRRPVDEESAQLELRAIARSLPVEGCPLGTEIPAVTCVARQLLSERELAGRRRAGRSRELARHDGKRGTATTYPSCRTDTCAIGRRVRDVLGDDPEADARAERAPRCNDTSIT